MRRGAVRLATRRAPGEPYHGGVRRARLRLILLVCLGTLWGAWALAQEALWESAAGRERVFNALVKVFRENYWDPEYLDWDAWSASYRDQAVAAETRAAFDEVMRRMVNQVGDDHSRWVGLVQGGGGGTATTGLGFQHSYLARQGIVVERVYPETPAAAQLRRGDLIVRVNGQEVRDLGGSYDVDRVLREAIGGGVVQLGVRRKNQLLSIEVQPTDIDFGRVSELPQGAMLDASTGYLYIPSFKPEGLAQEVNRLLGELVARGATSLVLDMRDNLGGRLGELGLVLGAFIDGPWVEAVSHGAVVWRSSYARDEGRGTNVLETAEGAPFAGDDLSDPVRFSGPLAVLVSRQNSSAGEVAPLVLQSRGRATVLGEPTAGNVEAIQAFDLPDGSVTYVAVAMLRGVDGEDFSRGVQPDVVVKSSLQELARGFDAPVSEALRALKALPFTPGKFF